MIAGAMLGCCFPRADWLEVVPRLHTEEMTRRRQETLRRNDPPLIMERDARPE
jgi:hypothetical protein